MYKNLNKGLWQGCQRLKKNKINKYLYYTMLLIYFVTICNLKLLDSDAIQQRFVKYKHTNYIIFVDQYIRKKLMQKIIRKS